MRERWWSVFLALVLAVFSWYHVTGREQVETVIEMPVEMVNPPEGVTIRSGMVNRISVRVRGPKGLVRGLANKDLAYSLDAGKLKIGNNTITFREEAIPLSKTFEIVEITPSRARINVDRLVERTLPVKPVYAGKLGQDMRLAQSSARPNATRVWGPAKTVSPLSSIPTAPLKVPGLEPGTWSGEAELEPPDEAETEPSVVQVTLRFDYQRRSLWIKTPLEVDAPDGWRIRLNRSSVRLLVNGPTPFFRDKNFREHIRARLLPPAEPAPGEDSLLYRVVLPESCHLVQAEPVRVKVRISRQR
jgi:YbbR domain-containing protein